MTSKRRSTNIFCAYSTQGPGLIIMSPQNMQSSFQFRLSVIQHNDTHITSKPHLSPSFRPSASLEIGRRRGGDAFSPCRSSEPVEEIRSARCDQRLFSLGLAPCFPFLTQERNQKYKGGTKLCGHTGALGVDIFIYALGLLLGAQDTTVGKSDPILTLGREIDLKVIKHTIKNSCHYCDCNADHGGKTHNVLNGLTRALVWLELSSKSKQEQ